MKKHYVGFDILRVVSCITILFYHLNILKGGYLAVCTFFVLSGYLSAISCLKKDKLSLKDYYISRFKKIYLPMIIVVFLSISIISLTTSYNWINLKNEVTSILLGYNNYWQINANLDYFVRNVSSPFMHLWFLSIIIQFEIIFPFIFLFFKKIKEKTNKIIPCIILIILGIISYILFNKNISNNIMYAYYDTLSRLFSVIFGVLLGYIHVYFKPITIKNNILSKIICIIYLSLLIYLFIMIDSSSSIFGLSMLITTFISIRLIDYSITINNNIKDELLLFLSKISYEIYLVQYPIIFILQYLKLNNYLNIVIVILSTFIISIILYYLLNIRSKKTKYIKFIGLIIVSIISIYGLFKYITAKDYSSEMNKIEKDINKNKKKQEEKRKEYIEKAKEQEEKKEESTKEYVSNMRLVGIGDSIMELALNDLSDRFPNGYFDGEVNRTEKKSFDLLNELNDKGLLGDAVLFNIGTNDSNCNLKCKENLLDIIGDRKLFWVNATNPDVDTFNQGLEDFASKHDNVYIIDWVSVAKEHPEYIYRDGVHPTPAGSKAYAETIYNEICKVYMKNK